MADLIRGTALLHFANLVSQLGGDPEAVARGCGVDPSAVGDPDRFILYSRMAALMGAAARELDCPDFGMRLGRKQGIQFLGPVAVLLRHSETIADALEGVCRYLKVLAPPDIAELRRGRHTANFSYSIALRQLAHRDQMIEKTFSVTMEAFRLMLGGEFVPLKVTLQHPRISPPERYREVFGCPVSFGAEENSVQFPIDVLNRQVPGRDAAALALAENYLALAEPTISIVDQVRETIHHLLKIHRATLLTVADAIALHPRVLQRRLAEVGTSFEEILDAVRRALSWQLSATGMRVSLIATMLGYSEQSTYTRACQRWYGVSPRQLIAQRRTTTSFGTAPEAFSLPPDMFRMPEVTDEAGSGRLKVTIPGGFSPTDHL
ncbi:HTH-type transcriptional regulator VirS [Paraburkholderia nemoris]|uniref:AraC family transcriptional regulator n=1 Tax=Paraburkholderia nemoris TaxID=2793076 RepID=UPI00190A5E22|nr:AraC family transcriptional regulator [Paraburkholderia nemoris]MBK3742592.1 AraC family transcriptional regulator [Paraburkholderia aspalathi]CAE6786951.1 HTH-type transcriptional regulator VirS [Paraburkholderia nemoris]